jgi:hypothetical protein
MHYTYALEAVNQKRLPQENKRLSGQGRVDGRMRRGSRQKN